jgi:aspartate aminotransferase
LSPPTYALLASEAALDTPQSYFDAVIREYEARRNLLMEGLCRIEGVRVARPQGAFYCIAALPIEDADDFARWLLEDFSYEGTTVMVAPAAGFYATEGLGKNEIRIAYVLEKERLKKALMILEKAIIRYQGL